ncbi:MAG: hypothetical protein ACK46L_14675 [Synechococcaceae cyanobacterium]
MARFSPMTRRRRPRGPRPPGRAATGLGPWPSGWTLDALTLLLLGGVLLVFNQNHSGDPLKIRRELRKF